ncbi:MAG: hypothetical protein HKN47_23250 [Pirellulaceae bacterium]|nr:hypothetical protein [Pirellulaceae bacterium]
MNTPSNTNRTGYPRGNRAAYTLIELVAAMTASTILMAALAATVLISTTMLESPADDRRAWRDRDLSDRVAADLRYATTIDDNFSNGFQLSKANVYNGAAENVTYDAYVEGLTRTVGAGPTIQLDSEAPSHSFTVDGYSAPSSIAQSTSVRVRATSATSAPGTVSTFLADFPAGCKNGDGVIIAIAANSPSSVSIGPSGWNLIYAENKGTLRSFIAYNIYDSSNPGPAIISFNEPSDAVAVMIAFENASEFDPANWFDDDKGTAVFDTPQTHPQPKEPTDGATLPKHLNLQIIAANGNPWPNQTLGVASFTDAAKATSIGDVNSVGIVFRNGAAPVLPDPPRFWQQTTGDWIRVGMRLGTGS